MSPYTFALARTGQTSHRCFMTMAELKTEAGRLPENERGMLAAELLATLAPPGYDVNDEEVTRRVEELENGTVDDISLEELRSRVNRARGT